MVKELNPVLASHKARKQKEREKSRREKLESKTLKQAGIDGGGVKQRLDEEIKKIRDMRGPKGRKRKLPPHLQLKLNQLETLSKQVKQRELSTSRTNIELSHRHKVFEKAERINEGMTDDEDDGDDDAQLQFDPLHATLTDKARAGLLDIDALKQERKRRGEHIRWHKAGESGQSNFELGMDDEGSDSEEDEGESKARQMTSNGGPLSDTQLPPPPTRPLEKSDSDDGGTSSSGSEIGEEDLASLPPPPPVATTRSAAPPVAATIPPPPPAALLAPRGPISYVGFSDPLPPPPMFPDSVAKSVYAGDATTSAPPPTWMVPTSVVSRLESQANKRQSPKSR